MELLKDQLFNKDTLKLVTKLIIKVYPELNNNFEKIVLNKFPELELKERIYWIRENFEKYLPKDYETSLNILLNSIKDEPEQEKFIFAVYSDYVAVNGCKKEFLEISLNALGEFTKHCSSEFAIRDFINKFPKQSFNKMQKWSLSKNVHQRRLASEGFRPKLPWAKSIEFNYKEAAEILDNLFYDNDRYVTRSVANHLNDISKIDPEFVLEKISAWKSSKRQNDQEMDYIIRHSLRTSIKMGHQGTFTFLGHNSKHNVTIDNLKSNENITLNEKLIFSFDITSKDKENLIIDYKITYPTPGRRVSTKVFKIKKLTINDQTLHIEKKHLFKKMTTKKLYQGEHQLEIIINSKIVGSTSFNLNF